MKKQRWDLRGRKWEQVKVPEILFLSKQDMLWCFIYKATKAQKAERVGLANLLYGVLTAATGRGGGKKLERWREGEGTDDIVYPTEGKAETWKLIKMVSKLTCWTDRRYEWSKVWCGPEKNKRRGKERERGVQYGTAVVTMANAAWCDVSLAAELS